MEIPHQHGDGMFNVHDVIITSIVFRKSFVLYSTTSLDGVVLDSS